MYMYNNEGVITDTVGMYMYNNEGVITDTVVSILWACIIMNSIV